MRPARTGPEAHDAAVDRGAVAAAGAVDAADPTAGAAADLWDIAVPRRPSPLPGVAMAGFAHRPWVAPVELRPLPHPAVTLVLDLGDRTVAVDDPAGEQRRGSMVVPLAPGPIRAHGSGLRCIQVRLPPPVAASVLGVPGVELDGRIVDLADLWGRDSARLTERLHEAATWNERFALVDDELVRRQRTGREVAPEVVHAWRQVVGHHGRVTVQGLSAEVGWSRKRFWSRFRAEVGLAPKPAAVLARFDHAAHRLAAGIAPAQVAAEAGYADQPHLHRDVRALAGVTPTVVARAPWLAVDPVAWPTTAA